MFFVVSTGRAGSRTVANVLSQSPDALCLHEPVPYLVEETAEWRYGTVETVDLCSRLTESRPRQIDGKQYGESANRLSLAIPVLAEAFPDARFVWLTRDGREVVASGHQRGWFDPSRVRDTQWERHRLRADRLGEMGEREWSSMTPFAKGCWLWRRTNEIIAEDLEALGTDRWRRVAIEDLEESIDDVADFLGVERAVWSIPRLNARSNVRAPLEPNANLVDQIDTPSDWSDDQSSIFERECGGMMQRLYPASRPAENRPIASAVEVGPVAELEEIRSALADLGLLRGELRLAVEQQGRLQRANRLLQDQRSIDHAALEVERDRLKREAKELERSRAREKDLQVELQRSRTRAVELEKKALRADARARQRAQQLATLQESTSLRLGRLVVRTVRLPARLTRSARRLIGRLGRRAASGCVSFARQNRLVRALWRRLPPSARRRLRSSRAARIGARRGSEEFDRPRESGRVDALHAAASGRGRETGSRDPAVENIFRSGVRALVEPGVSSAWTSVVDVHPKMEADTDPPTHLDLVLTEGPLSDPVVERLAETHDALVVDTVTELAPLRPGLAPIGAPRSFSPHVLSIASTTAPVAAPASMVPGRAVELKQLGALPDRVVDPGAFRALVQGYSGLLDTGVLHEMPAQRARLLADVAACGLPVVLREPAGLERFLPPALLADFVSTTMRELSVPRTRELASRRQIRLVHELVSPRAVLDRLFDREGRPGFPPPSVSVNVATARPAMIDHWARLLAAQEYPNFEVVACLHGDAFTADDEHRARDLLGQRLTVHRVPEAYTLGDVLNTAARRSSGSLLVKWDDDDLYDRSHIADLVRAREWSAATLVGKAAEFAYLKELDITVRRIKSSTEQFSPTICGATLSIGKSDLEELGGWRRSRRRVDSLLIEDVRSAGGSTYRTSGLGFVMLRAGGVGHEHTWTADNEYFLRGAIDQRRGLDAVFAGVDAPSEVLERWTT